MAYFLDRNLGRLTFAAILRKAGVECVAHDELFAQDTPDVRWISEVGNQGLVAITLDTNISSNPLEIRAVHGAGMKMIACKGASAPMQQIAQNFVNTSGQIERFVKRHQGPFIARLQRPHELTDIQRGKPGKLRMFKSRDDLIALFGPVLNKEPDS